MNLSMVTELFFQWILVLGEYKRQVVRFFCVDWMPDFILNEKNGNYLIMSIYNQYNFLLFLKLSIFYIFYNSIKNRPTTQGLGGSSVVRVIPFHEANLHSIHSILYCLQEWSLSAKTEILPVHIKLKIKK